LCEAAQNFEVFSNISKLKLKIKKISTAVDVLFKACPMVPLSCRSNSGRTVPLIHFPFAGVIYLILDDVHREEVTRALEDQAERKLSIELYSADGMRACPEKVLCIH
jgi:hypothetical protein